MVCQNANRRFFFVTFLVLVVLFFYSLCFCAFVLFKTAQNGYFPAFLEFFCLFCSHERPVLKCFFSSYFVFFFAFVFLFKNPFLYFLFVHQPLFYKRLFVGFLFFFFCLSFPFLRFACLFDTNFPNIPFLKSNLLSFLAVSFFFCCSCFLFSLCKFQPFCFFLVMLALFLVLFCFVLFCVFVFVLLSCFAFSLWKKGCFPCKSGVFELCWLKG